MDVFKDYAKYYDLLYQEKNYEEECDFIEQVFRGFSKLKVKSILELGCGTGGHAIPLARRQV
jgi:predicted TPR repeat methyltransferase